MSPRIKNGNDLGFTSHVRTDGILLRPAQRVLRYIVQKSKDRVTSYSCLLSRRVVRLTFSMHPTDWVLDRLTTHVPCGFTWPFISDLTSFLHFEMKWVAGMRS